MPIPKALDERPEDLKLFFQCIQAARSCYAARDRDGFRLTLRLAQAQAVGDSEVNQLLEEAIGLFPAPQALELVNAAEILRRAG